MAAVESNRDTSLVQKREQQIEKYRAGELARRVYLLRRQRKAILEHCRRIAVVGASDEPDGASFITMEKLLGLGLEIIPVFPKRESLLGLRCYASLGEIPGPIDVVQVYTSQEINLAEVAQEAVEKRAAAFWIEKGVAASEDVEEILANGKIQLVEHESLETEYLKHFPATAAPAPFPRKEKKVAKVRERMTKNPSTVKPDDGLKDAIWKMERGQFRHLPVVDDNDRLIGILSDRDIRLIRPSLAFVGKDDAMVQLWSIAVQQAAVFDPVTVKPETTLKDAAELMLRWHVGGLPVVNDQAKLVGIITYSDILREFVGRDDAQ